MDERWKVAIAGGVGGGSGCKVNIGEYLGSQVQVQLQTEPVSAKELVSPIGRPLISEPFAVITSPSSRTAPWAAWVSFLKHKTHI